MAKDAPAPQPPGDGVSENDYAALLATLSASARGRAFLDEFVRRQRAADTALILAALDRLEAKIDARQPPSVAETAQPKDQLPKDQLPKDQLPKDQLPKDQQTEAPAVKSAVTDTPLARFTVVAPPAERAMVATPARASDAAALHHPTAAAIPEVMWQDVPWQTVDATPADDRIKITIADDEPAAVRIDDQPESVAVDASSQDARAAQAPAIEPAAAPERPPTEPVAVAVTIAAEVEASVAVPSTEPAAPVLANDAPEEPAPSAGDALQETAAVNSTLEQMASLAHDALSLAHVALGQAALPSAEAPRPPEPTQPMAQPCGLIDQPEPSPNNPLAQLMALSDEERIALFS